MVVGRFRDDEGRIIPLSELPVGACGKILEVGGNGALKQRLLELGFVPGTYIWTERIAPLGEPISYFIRGSVISLRREEAGEVLVRVCAEPHRWRKGRKRFRFRGGFLP